MTDNGSTVPLAVREMAAEFTQIGQRAVDNAKAESRRLGVPNVHSINGRIFYELPNGELSPEDPGVTQQPSAPAGVVAPLTVEPGGTPSQIVAS